MGVVGGQGNVVSTKTNNSSGASGESGGAGPTAVAQLAEQRIPNPQVAGSIPSRRASDGGGSDRPGDESSVGPWGIYKYGQGYWVRMLTAVLAGTLILMGAAWSWSRLAVVSIPITGYSLSVTQVSGNLAPAETVELFKGREKIGTAAVESFVPLAGDASGVAKVKDVALDKGRIAADIDRVRLGDAASPTFSGVVAGRDPKFLFPKVYLQAGVASLIVLLGGFFLHRFVAARPTTVDFLVATDSEMKKVNWSTRQVIQDTTIVVIGATFLIAGFIFVADIGLRMLMELIGVLKTG